MTVGMSVVSFIGLFISAQFIALTGFAGFLSDLTLLFILIPVPHLLVLVYTTFKLKIYYPIFSFLLSLAYMELFFIWAGSAISQIN